MRVSGAIVVGMIGWTALASPAAADCDNFRWSLAREKGWFAKPVALDVGAPIAPAARAYTVTLKAPGAEGYVLAPSRPSKPNEFGATVQVGAIAQAGVYEVTVTREGWVDVIQGGVRARTRSVSRQRDCPLFVKSVRFGLVEGSATLQFSGFPTPSLSFSIIEAGPE